MESLISAKEQCMKQRSCIGVSVMGCKEYNNDVRLCHVESGFVDSRRRTCVYVKKGQFWTSLDNLSFWFGLILKSGVTHFLNLKSSS